MQSTGLWQYPEECLKRHAMKPKLSWTSDPPARNGFYWLRFSGTSEPTLAEVCDGKVLFAGHSMALKMNLLPSSNLWFGPLEPPEED